MRQIDRAVSRAALFGTVMLICVAGLVAGGAAQENTIEAHVAAAQALAAKDPSGTIAKAAGLCPSTNPGAASSALAGLSGNPNTRHFASLPPTRVFDNLYFLGDEFVGAWVVKTSQGLIMIDSFGSSIDARRYLTGDLVQLGLDPKDIKYVFVTHGHWDHYGGSGMIQATYGARVIMGQKDWDALLTAATWGSEREGVVPPKKDIVVKDEPMDFTLGDTTIKLFPTPGHTPGTVSALVPVKLGGVPYQVAVWGGNAVPFQLEPVDPKETAAWRNSGLLRMEKSLRAYMDWVERNGGADSVLSSHTAAANDPKTLAAVRALKPGEPNPILLGKTVTRGYFEALDHCMQALIIKDRAAEKTKSP